ncbi:MAG TPA: metallophosphoesterase [Chthoniobacteraceae bacterium]|nr:metallophosphoesterase [Chthoniobacteraceae bacterium]
MSLFLLFLSTFIVADALVWVRGAIRLRKKGASRVARALFHLFMILQAGSLAMILGTRSLGLNVDDFLPTYVLVLVYIWHFLLALPTLILHLIGLFWAAARAIWRSLAPQRRGFGTMPIIQPVPVRGRSVSRREFLATTAILTPPILTLGLGVLGQRQLSQVGVRRLTVTLPTLPPALDGLTIAHLSDTHVGRFTHGAVLDEIVTRTNALKADLTLFTGDLIDHSLDALPSAVRMLEQIEGPVVVCEGNHDLFESASQFRETLKASSGFTTLINEATTLTLRGETVQLLGLRWGGPPSEKRQRYSEEQMASSLRDLLALRLPSAFPILLAHHPHAWDHAPGIPLTFAGHTHGGQFMLTGELGMGPAMFRYWSGLYTRNDASGSPSALVVSNGTGNWFPLRVGAPAEIIHLTLRREAATDGTA